MSTTTTLAPADARVAGTPTRSLLRVALGLDAAVSAVSGVAYLVAAGPLGEALGLAPGLLRGAGAFLVVFAVGVGLLARRTAIPPGPVLGVVAVNAVWAADSVLAAGVGWGSPTAAGTAWIVLQGVAVGALGALQLVGRRRARSAAGAP